MTAVDSRVRPAIRVVGPSIRDPRLHTAAVLVTVQVLGQAVLEFDVSIAQIVIAIGTSALLEVAITFHRRRALVWPASAMLTGNGVALILRVPGTVHGDWWSTRGAGIFAATAGVSLLSKYAIRVGRRHVFNPSNIGLLAAFVVLGSARAEPLDFWWGPRSVSIAAAAAVIVVGGVLILRRLGLLVVALMFWLTFAVALAVVTLPGHCVTARWHVGPLCGFAFWSIIVTSPELLIFLFFMITDPRTIPSGQGPRAAYAVTIGVLAALLIAPARSEFGAKVALLAALTIACAARPLLERLRSPCSALTRVAAVAATATAALALVAAGSRARPLAARTVPIAVEFPAVAPSALPRVSIARDRLSRQVRMADARAIAHDLVQDFAVQEQVLRRRDVDLLPAVSGRAWGATLAARMRTAARRGQVTVERFALRELIVSVARRRGQTAPAVLATLRGTQRAVVWHDGADVPTQVGPRRPLDRTFEVLWDGARYVVVSDQRPEGWSPPR